MALVSTAKEGSVLRVTLNRPELHNAFNPVMIQELTKIFRSVKTDTSVSAAILCGAGKSFCSGADLEWMRSMVDFSVVENEGDSRALFEMFEAIWSCPAPVLAKAHGNVMGGGLGLLAACDIVAAVEDTRFCFSEVKLGLVPAVISPFVLRKTALHLAREVMLTAEVFDAAKATHMGLVNFSGENEEVDDFLESRLDHLLANGPEALRVTKGLLNEVGSTPWDRVKALTTKTIAERRVSKEGQEGLKSFLEKRKPSWKKK